MKKFYLDTSILVPLLVGYHPNHEAATQLLIDINKKGIGVTSATHAYAELYRTLTRGKSPIEHDPADAQLAITQGLDHLLEVIVLDKSDYEAAIQRCVDLDLTSSIIYDALHVQAALKIAAEVIYTDNLRDFNRLVTPEDNLRVEGIRS